MIKKILFLSVLLVIGGMFTVVFYRLYIAEKEEYHRPPSTITYQPSLLEKTNNDFVLIASNENYSFYFRARRLDFYVESKTGTKWYSTPENKNDDDIAKGISKTNLSSHLLINYSDGISNEFVNSYSGSVLSRDFELFDLENGIRVEYFFPKQGFTIPVNYILEEDRMNIEIDALGIKEEVVEFTKKETDYDSGQIIEVKFYKQYYITRIALMPYFNSGTENDNGYVLLPDGSGALIDFTNTKSTFGNYEQYVYGRDEALNLNQLTLNRQKVTLPLYGIKKNQQSILSVIQHGDEYAILNASPGGKDTMFTTAYFTFEFHQSERVLFFEQTYSQKRDIEIVNERSFPGDKVSVYYYFLEDEDSDYVGMAHKYRDILGLDRLNQENVPLFVEVYGAVKDKRSFLGIPFNRTIPLTTVEETIDIAKDMSQYTDELVLKYTGWTNDGLINGELPIDAKQNRKLGSKKDYQEMLEYFKKQNIAYYANVDLVNFKNSGNGIYKYFDSTKGISKAPALVYSYYLSNLRKNPNIVPGYLLSPDLYEETIDEFINKYERRYGENNFAFDSLGQILYSNFGSKDIDKIKAQQHQIDAIKNGNYDHLALYNPNAYYLPYVDHVYGVPVVSSHYDVFTRTIPFYQIIFTGSVNYSTPAINHSDSPREVFLKAIETGSNLSFSIYAQNAYELIDTDADYLNNSNYDQWKDDIKTMYDAYRDFKIHFLNVFITDHEEIATNVFKTTYENGSFVIVNYNDTPFDFVDGNQTTTIDDYYYEYS